MKGMRLFYGSLENATPRSRTVPPNHSNGRHFFREKKSKSLIQQGF